MKNPSARPKKFLGQHFLKDKRVLSDIGVAADLSPNDIVVEIGPGRGILTKYLSSRVKRVIAVELDVDLVDELSANLSEYENVKIIHSDARKLDLVNLLSQGIEYKVVANLPYYAALPIVRVFLESKIKPIRMVVMLQREVARKIVAMPGDISLPSIAIQLYGHPRIVKYVSPMSFRPIPKVTSAILRIDVYSEPVLNLESEEDFFKFVKAVFIAPRKQIRNCLRTNLSLENSETDNLLSGAHIDPVRRPQTINLQEWGTLYNCWKKILRKQGINDCL